MRIVSNTGTERVVDLIQPWLRPGNRLDLASGSLSLHAFGELAEKLSRMAEARLVLPPEDTELGLFGADGDRAARNRLQGRWLARPLRGLGREDGRGAQSRPTRPTRSRGAPQR